MLYRPHLRPPSDNPLARVFGLSPSPSPSSASLLLGSRRRSERRRMGTAEGRRMRRRTTRTVETRWRRSRPGREANAAGGTRRAPLPALHVVAQTNRGTRSLFLSGGCGGDGTKSLRLPPRVLSPPLSLSLSPQPLFPRVSLRVPSLALVRPGPPLSSLPFHHTAVLLALFFSSFFLFLFFLLLFSLRLFLCHRTAPGPSLPPAPRFPPCSIRAILSSRSLPSSAVLPPPLSLSLSLSLSPAPELNYYQRRFFDEKSPALPAVSSTCKPIAHASEGASEEIGTGERGAGGRKREGGKRRREREKKRETVSRVPYTAERAKTRRGRAGARERGDGAVGWNQRGYRSEERWDTRRGRKEEEEGKKRRMLKRGRASGTPRATG